MPSAEVIGWIVVTLWTVAAGLAGAYLALGVRNRLHKGPRR